MRVKETLARSRGGQRPSLEKHPVLRPASRASSPGLVVRRYHGQGNPHCCYAPSLYCYFLFSFARVEASSLCLQLAPAGCCCCCCLLPPIRSRGVCTASGAGCPWIDGSILLHNLTNRSGTISPLTGVSCICYSLPRPHLDLDINHHDRHTTDIRCPSWQLQHLVDSLPFPLPPSTTR